jgi:hypothetical protein
MTSGTKVTRAFRMILADGRRALDEDQERAAQTLWRKVFLSTPERLLLQAVETWLVEHPRGRPGVGEIMAVIRSLAPAASEVKRSSSSIDDERSRSEPRWAVNILAAFENDRDFRERLSLPNYKHTLESAHYALKKRGFSTWQEARSHLEPGWAPTVATEILR